MRCSYRTPLKEAFSVRSSPAPSSMPNIPAPLLGRQLSETRNPFLPSQGSEEPPDRRFSGLVRPRAALLTAPRSFHQSLPVPALYCSKNQRRTFVVRVRSAAFGVLDSQRYLPTSPIRDFNSST